MVTAKTTPGAVLRLTSSRSDDGFIRARALSDSTIMITVFGDIDAASAEDLCDGIERHLGRHSQLVLDFSRVGFFGTAGFEVLSRLHARCQRAGVDWVLVPGPEVARLLRICDPNNVLRTAPNIVSAVAVLSRLPHRTSHLRAVAR
ncbi:MAG: STAS domain-containing protein [Mycobacterium sp.]|nr:STAS domain-containing protein [Mycobacterium sp.]